MYIHPIPLYSKLKEKAVSFRKLGWSYSEILKEIPVSQSTLSLWLRDISLTQSQKERLNKKEIANRALGSNALKCNRINKTKEIVELALNEIGTISQKELWLIGIALYWAEGHKQKDYRPSTRVMFNNSDIFMLKLYIKWLEQCLKIPKSDICFEIYIHETYEKTKESLIEYWSNVTGFPASEFDKIYYKHNKVHSYRRNRGDSYFGVLRVSVIKSTDLNRKITGWIKGICKQCGIV